MKTTVITPADGEPVPLSAVKEYLRIGHDGEDGLISSLIASARARLEAELQRALLTRTVKVEYSGWPISLAKAGLKLVPGPVSALIEVAVIDSTDDGETITSRFMLQDGVLRIRPWSFIPPVDAGGRIEVTFETGYGAQGNVPDDLVLAVKILAAHAYHVRGGGREIDEDALPGEVDDLLFPYKGVRL